jgi:hypothetical protein
MLTLLTGSQQKLSKDAVNNIVAVSNFASRMITLFYTKAKDIEEERTFDEKRMYG